MANRMGEPDLEKTWLDLQAASAHQFDAPKPKEAKNAEKLAAKLMKAVHKQQELETRLARVFGQWNKNRGTIKYLEKELDKLSDLKVD